MQKKYDATAVVGEYTDRQGNAKKRYKTVGTVFEGDKGLSMKLDRTFNPAGCPDKDGSGEIWLNFYEPKERGEPATDVKRTIASKAQAPLDDDGSIPF